MNSKLAWNKVTENSGKYDHYKLNNLIAYEKRSKVFNKDYSIFWSGKRAQESRFETLIKIGDLNNKTILDVGCGWGSFFSFLKEKNINVKKYHGVDINEEVIKKAKNLFNLVKNVTFEKRDILIDPLPSHSFDYVFASGIFAFDGDDWEDYVRDMLKEMYRICTSGVGVNFLKKNNHYNYPTLRYNNPNDVYELVKKEITYKVVLKDNYAIDDFTLFLYKFKEDE
uniref:Class I SAM-dependent methyltransferase n=1 Tax=Dictyoglomus turgidum TaxID=513050 RepID=A0A7C3SQ70_9BACT